MGCEGKGWQELLRILCHLLVVPRGSIPPLQPPVDTVLPGAFWDPLPFAVSSAHAPGGRQDRAGPGSNPGTRSLITAQSFSKIGLKPSRAAVFAPNFPGTRRPLRAAAQRPAPPSAWAANPGPGAVPGGRHRLSSWLECQKAGNKPGKGCQSSRPLHSAWLPLLSSLGHLTHEPSQL